MMRRTYKRALALCLACVLALLPVLPAAAAGEPGNTLMIRTPPAAASSVTRIPTPTDCALLSCIIASNSSAV